MRRRSDREYQTRFTYAREVCAGNCSGTGETPEDLFQVANFAVHQGWRIGTHVVGDRAVRTALDVYEQVSRENPGLRPGTLVLEHAFLANAEQRARAIRLGIPITVQHPLLYTLAPILLAGWGEERTREVMLVRAWLEEGASFAAGTDYPVSSYQPLLAIWGMVTRGTQQAGIQGPEYAIDQYTAVRLYTAAGAELSGESQRRGTLQPRRLADLVAYRADPITCPVDDLPHLCSRFSPSLGVVPCMILTESCVRATNVCGSGRLFIGEQAEGVRARDRLRAEASMQLLESGQSRALAPHEYTLRPRCRSSTERKGAVADQMR